MESPSKFPTLQLLVALVESRAPSPISISHAVWFSASGEVEGHFYIPERRTDLASGALHFSVCWPPSKIAAAERGEDRITRRRRQRRNVFEAFTASSAVGQKDDANVSTASLMSSISRPSVASDVVAVLVHPPRTTEHNGECSLDYLDAQRLQQYCDLPPPPVGTADSSSALQNANSSNQEAILIKLPSAVAPHYKFSVAYISCHANNGTIASELRQSKHHYVSPPTESNNNNTGAASPDSSSPAGSPSHKSGGSGGRPLSPAPAIPITKRTNANSVVAMPPGFSRRLTEIGGVCARTFPADWWGTTNNTAAAAQRNNTININRQQQQQKFFLQQRLGMFFLVEYSTQVYHVTRFSLLCVTDAPMLPPPIVSLPASLSPILKNQENHKHGASKKQQAAASPLVVDDETPEDISWTIPSNKKEEPTVVRNGTSANHPSGADVETGVATSRWTFVKQESHSQQQQQHQPQHKNSSASANDFNTHARHLKRAEEAADRRMRAASPGGFLLPSTQDFEKAPQGRYEHHRSESNRHVLSKTTRPAWQVYDQQRYDDAVHDAERFSREHVSAADQLEHQRPLAEHEIESYAYLTGQREGSMLGYLVDGPSPIARLDNLKVTAPAASVSRSTLLLTATNTNAMDHGNSATTVVHVAGGGGGTSCTAVPASHLHSTSSECISSQTLRLLQTTERNNVMTRTADPFLRIRNGLIPAIQRHHPKQHRPQQQRHARKDVGTVEKELSPSRQQLAPIPSVEFVATTIAANKLMTPTSSTNGCIFVDHNASGSALANTTQRTMMGPRIGRASNRNAKPVQRRTFLDRFVEAVERIEIARGCDAIGNPLLLPRTGEDGSSSASSSSPHSNHDQQSHHHRRPTPLVAFGGLTPGNGVGIGGSVNTPWTPWRTTPIAGLKDPAASSGRGGVSFATDTPRSAFKRLLCIEPIAQSLDDFFYAIYSLHGGAASTAEDSSSLTRQQQQQLGVTSMTKLPIVSHAAPEVALEALFWMAHHAPCKLGSAAVMVRRKENSVDEASETTASLEQPSATPTEAAEQPSPTASPAAKGFECTVILQVVNDYAALAKIKTVLERTIDMLTTRISSNPLPLTESLRSCIRNRKQFTRVSVAEAYEAHVRQRRKSMASEVPPVQSTTPAVIRGGSKAARVGKDEDEDDETVIKRRGVDLTSLFYDSVPTCSINEWIMKAE